MILNGNQRGGARQMAAHLLNGEKNEHVSVHEVSGFVSNDVHGALNEAYALSKGTKCRQFMYSLSLNPPPDRSVPIETFENALGRIEKRLNLEGQPRVIVFHEKEGRRHAHCVWSRIDTDEMKAINISHPKLKLTSISKSLYLENGWDLPQGFIDRNQKNPLNFTRSEWEQAQRTGQNPKAIKGALQESWAVSDSRKALGHAMQDRGFYLAKGDKRGFVAVDLYGEVYSLTRQLGLKKADLEKRLGKSQELPSVDEARQIISRKLTGQFKTYFDEINQEKMRAQEILRRDIKQLTIHHRQARLTQSTSHKLRWQGEELKRSARLRKGFKGLWDRLTGTYQRTRAKNEKETEAARQRDQRQREALIAKQLSERKLQQTKVHELAAKYQAKRAELLKGMNRHYRKVDRQDEIRKLYEQEKQRTQHQKRDQNPDFEPEI